MKKRCSVRILLLTLLLAASATGCSPATQSAAGSSDLAPPASSSQPPSSAPASSAPASSAPVSSAPTAPASSAAAHSAPQSSLRALSVDQALDAGYAVQAGGEGSLAAAYNIDGLDRFVDGMSGGGSAEIFLSAYVWNGPAPEQTGLWYLSGGSDGSYLYPYTLAGGVFTCQPPVKIDRIVKSSTAAGTVYQTQGSAAGASGTLLTAVNIIAPADAADCVQQYEKAEMNRNGVTQYALLSKKARAAFDKSSWITGVSSPGIQAYAVTDTAGSGDSLTVNGTLTWHLSGSPDSVEKDAYTVIRENGALRIDSVKIVSPPKF